MPTVTVTGSNSTPINYQATDAAAAAQTVASQIANTINAGAPTTQYTGASSITGSTVAVFSSAPAPSAVALGSTVAVIDSLTTPVSLTGGAAGLAVVAGSGGLSLTNITPSGTTVDNIVAGDGANVLATSATAAAGLYNVATGAGNDSINILSGNATVNAGTGSNTIILGGSAGSGNSLVNSQGADDIRGNYIPAGQPGGGGTDTINIGAGAATVTTGTSNFFIYGNSGNALIVKPGTGSDTVIVGAGGGSIVGGLAGKNVFEAGGYGGSNGTTLVGGGNGDQLFAVGTGRVTIFAGAGNEFITGAQSIPGSATNPAFAASTADNLLVAGSGNTTINAGLGNDTLQTAQGKSTLTGGAGADTFRITSNTPGGQDLIVGFKAGDTLQFLGYGTSPQGFVQGGNTVFSLVDGTSVTLQGVTNLNSAQIKFS